MFGRDKEQWGWETTGRFSKDTLGFRWRSKALGVRSEASERMSEKLPSQLSFQREIFKDT